MYLYMLALRIALLRSPFGSCLGAHLCEPGNDTCHLPYSLSYVLLCVLTHEEACAAVHHPGGRVLRGCGQGSVVAVGRSRRWCPAGCHSEVAVAASGGAGLSRKVTAVFDKYCVFGLFENQNVNL